MTNEPPRFAWEEDTEEAAISAAVDVARSDWPEWRAA